MGDVKRMIGTIGLRSKENEVMLQLDNYATPRLEPRERVKLFVLKECLDPKQDWIK